MATSRTQAERRPTDAPADIAFVGPCSEHDAALCRRFGVPVVTDADSGQWTVRRLPDGHLELRTAAVQPTLAVGQDPRRGDLARRLATARPKQPLPRAAGLPRRSSRPSVFDATAGFGRDALVLAQLGCPVVACERIPALAMILEDTARLAGLTELVDVVCADAIEQLDAAGDVDVVLLDPMFPEPGRAQVRKEMQVCRLLSAPPTDDTAVLFLRARAAARDRVVVKRHPHEQPLAGAPSFAVDGDRVRFDVYLRPAAADRPTP